MMNAYDEALQEYGAVIENLSAHLKDRPREMSRRRNRSKRSILKDSSHSCENSSLDLSEKSGISSTGSYMSGCSHDRSVAFSTVSIHEHEMVMGDNPITSSGPPVEIAWDAQHSVSLDLEDYESVRPPRRDKAQLNMPGSHRANILIESGYSRAEIKEQLQRIAEERKKAAKKSIPQKCQNMTRSIAKIVKKTVTRKACAATSA